MLWTILAVFLILAGPAGAWACSCSTPGIEHDPLSRLQPLIRKCFWEVNPDIRMDIRTR